MEQYLRDIIILCFATFGTIWWLTLAKNKRSKLYIVFFGLSFLITAILFIGGKTFDTPLLAQLSGISLVVSIICLVKAILLERNPRGQRR